MSERSDWGHNASHYHKDTLPEDNSKEDSLKNIEEALTASIDAHEAFDLTPQLELCEQALTELQAIRKNYVLVPRELLDRWVDCSYLREPDKKYPNIREDTIAMIKASEEKTDD